MQLKWILSHVRGYLELGMIDDAEEELAQVSPNDTGLFEVRALRALVQQEKKQWKALAKTAEGLARERPEEAAGWVLWAYAVRRAVSLDAAERILLEAETNHPKEATILFNLGCYACQRGDLQLAQERVSRAISLDQHFREAARTDPDLDPLRKRGCAF